ncbi:probable LRR receptor-like serine/threonine-protein kinase At3g47570 [Camellia sinensis]|uniref:probable LRR receptor-like serine/threonine-protein kinase At3g47570 n=1 Tax=Camellia sinensis TaxID=4442 RepID=UPI00103677CB|nr:probable LRR receptor-like serine/threonine-protein kinase At3g47570 [Camellia sinensis]
MINLGQFNVSENIPSTLGDCLVLKFLYMEGNHFEGTIPPSFKQLRGVQEIDLSNNNLSGKIPVFLGKFSLLQSLNVSYNKFEGEVPSKGVFSNISAFSIVGNSKLCGGNKALQLPACPTKISKKQGKHFHNIVLSIAISVPVCIILLLACICAKMYWNKGLKEKIASTLLLVNQYPNIYYAELLKETEGFSSRNLIGEGSYGSVYKGILNCETIRAIAVKPSNVLDDDLSTSVSDFGLARICLTKTGASTHRHNSASSRIRGTTGYIAPEWPNESNKTSGSSRDNVVRTVKCLERILQIGVVCFADLHSERVNISDALMELQVIRDVYLRKRKT